MAFAARWGSLGYSWFPHSEQEDDLALSPRPVADMATKPKAYDSFLYRKHDWFLVSLKFPCES